MEDKKLPRASKKGAKKMAVDTVSTTPMSDQKANKTGEQEEQTDSKTKALFSKVRKSIDFRYVAVALVIVVVGVLLYFYRGKFIVAMVNNEPIWRLSMLTELESKYGKEQADVFITKALVLQEAKKNNIAISKEEIDTEVNSIEKTVTDQGMTLEAALSMQGMTLEVLREQIELQKIAEQFTSSTIDVTDEEVETYITQNASSFTEGATAEDKQTQAREYLEGQEKNTAIQTWLSELKSKANIDYYVEYLP